MDRQKRKWELKREFKNVYLGIHCIIYRYILGPYNVHILYTMYYILQYTIYYTCLYEGPVNQD